MTFRTTLVLPLACSLLAGCAIESEEPGVESTASEIRTLKANEVVGFLNYGDKATTTYTQSPMYRAFKFRGNAYDTLRVSLTPLDADRALDVVLTDAEFHDLAKGLPDADGSGKVSVTYKAGDHFADYYVVVRETTFQKTKISVELASNGVYSKVTPVDLVPGGNGSYAPPTSLSGDVDVAMKCAVRRHEWENTVKESTGAGVISLNLAAGKVTVTGSDGQASRLQGAALSTEKTFTNGVWLRGPGAAATRHVLQITNLDSKHARVEYSEVSIYGNTGTVATETSCLGVAEL